MIATNMAGRGVDIKLGGSPEHLAKVELKKKGLQEGSEAYEAALAEETKRFEEQCEAEGDEIRELGGLFICGTERHESRRIDNQLRGRSGRQGDPGESRFFLSAEDDLVRLFAGDRIYKILDRLGPVDDEGEEYPLEAKMLSKQIENAQKKVEQQNFLIRKRVLEYDDVLNEQRRVVYKYRREILEGRDMSDVVGRSSATSSPAWSPSTRRARSSRTGTWPGSRRRPASSGRCRGLGRRRRRRPIGPRRDRGDPGRGRDGGVRASARRSSATS